MDCAAYISRLAGTVHWCGEGVEEEPPAQVEDAALYIAVPNKTELGLGRSLAFAFVEQQIPDSSEAVHEFFRKRGAYAKFKSLLARAGQLDAWHRYQEAATEAALREWCEDNGFEPVR